MNGMERRFLLNSQAELHNSKTWSGQSASLVLSFCKASLSKAAVTEDQPLSTWQLCDSKNFKSVSNSKSTRAFLKSSRPAHSCKDSKSSQCPDVAESQKSLPVQRSCTVALGGCGLLGPKNESLSCRLWSGSSYTELSCLKAIFFLISQDKIVAAIDLSGFFSRNWKSSELPLPEVSPLSLKHFQTVFSMAVFTQNTILHLRKHVIDSQHSCRYYRTLPFSTFFHCLNRKNQYWSDNDSLQRICIFKLQAPFQNTRIYVLDLKRRKLPCIFHSV